jgi:hypothetical protein
MQHWAAVVDALQFATERLYAHETVVVPAPVVMPTADDPVLLLVAGDPPLLFGLGKIISWHGPSGSFAADSSPHGLVTVVYTHRLLDEPTPADLHAPTPALYPLTSDEYAQLAAPAPASTRVDADRAEWFVSVTLPIEAATRAEAVREFWSHVEKLGPQELPAYVWPRGDELAMQAFVLGAPTLDDPEDADPA